MAEPGYERGIHSNRQIQEVIEDFCSAEATDVAQTVIRLG